MARQLERWSRPKLELLKQQACNAALVKRRWLASLDIRNLNVNPLGGRNKWVIW